VIRGIIKSVTEGVIKRFTASGRPDETITNREYLQHYGFSSIPLAGAEAILIKEDNHIVMIASDDRRYRVGLEAGEVCLYTDEGDQIRLKRDKEIYVKSGNKLTAEVENEVTVTAKSATVTAADLIHLKSKAIVLECESLSILSSTGSSAAALKGDFALEGSLTATGSVIDTTGNTNHHTH
jgi:phage baseplate assembly protein V